MRVREVLGRIRRAMARTEEPAGSDRAEAAAILDAHAQLYRAQGHARLLARLDQPGCLEVSGPSGVRYQLEVEVVWEHRRRGSLRVLLSIDGGPISPCFPLCQSFIIEPPGELAALGEADR